jgi:polyphosphate glucokinase
MSGRKGTRRASASGNAETRTLSIDIGGTGLKALVLGPDGEPVTDRVRVETPRPATPRAVLRAIVALVEPLGNFHRVSAGFPGVVVEGVTRSAANLHDTWHGFDLARALADCIGRPARVLNDVGVQGHAAIEGVGVEMVLTLGTGFGCALFHRGIYVPNLELAHHTFKNNRTYEDYLGARALEKSGKKKWNKRLGEAIDQIDRVWNPDRIYIGGGNAKHVRVALPPHVKVVGNIGGLGGAMLWRDATLVSRSPRSRDSGATVRSDAQTATATRATGREPRRDGDS